MWKVAFILAIFCKVALSVAEGSNLENEKDLVEIPLKGDLIIDNEMLKFSNYLIF